MLCGGLFLIVEMRKAVALGGEEQRAVIVDEIHDAVKPRGHVALLLRRFFSGIGQPVRPVGTFPFAAEKRLDHVRAVDRALHHPAHVVHAGHQQIVVRVVRVAAGEDAVVVPAVVGVPRADAVALDLRGHAHGGGQHGDGIGEIEQHGVRAVFFHGAGDVQYDRKSAQR